MSQKVALVMEGTEVYQHRPGKKPVKVYEADDLEQAVEIAEERYGPNNYYILF